jgi:hypothetical protein
MTTSLVVGDKTYSNSLQRHTMAVSAQAATLRATTNKLITGTAILQNCMMPFSCTYLLFLLRSEEGADRNLHNLDCWATNLNPKRKSR